MELTVVIQIWVRDKLAHHVALDRGSSSSCAGAENIPDVGNVEGSLDWLDDLCVEPKRAVLQVLKFCVRGKSNEKVDFVLPELG